MKGKTSFGDYRNGTPVNNQPNTVNEVNWAVDPDEFGNPVNEPKEFGNPVTAPHTFGNLIGSTPATPTFDPPAGTYGVPQKIIIASAGAYAIYITIDGGTPDPAVDALYEGSVFIPSSMTIRAIAQRDGVLSAVGTAAYTIIQP